MGKVEILKEINLTHPLRSGANSHNSHVGRKSKATAKKLVASTVWPKFVYDQYDAYLLMSSIKHHLENWITFESNQKQNNSKPNPTNVVATTTTKVTTGTSSANPSSTIKTTRTVTTTVRQVEVNTDESSSESEPEVLDQLNKSSSKSKAPNKPCEFSYWVAANLPLEDSQRMELLSFSCSIQRLRWLNSMLNKYTFLCCESCKVRICHRDDVFSMSSSGPQAAYVNPAGMVHETLTVMNATSLELHGRPSTEFSWFPG